jgi:hypothetical protein
MASNSIVTPQWVVNEIGRQFLNKVVLGSKVNRSYDSQFKVKGAKVGSTIQARLPQRPRAGSGSQINKQPIIDQTTPISITDQTNIGVELSTYTLTLEKSEIQRTVIIPAANALVQDMESKGFQRLYKKVPNSIGTVGVSPTANLTYTQGVAKLMDLTGNTDDLCAILSADQSAVIADAQKSNSNVGFGNSSAMKKGQFVMSNNLGVSEWYASPNVAVHTTGTFTASTPLVNVAGGVTEGSSSVVTDGWASGASSLKEGDVFTFAGVFEVNAGNFSTTGRQRQFTVTANTSDSTGAMTITFSPPVYASGPQQNVDALPADNAGISVWGSALSNGTLSTTTSRQGLIFAPDSFVLAMADAEDVDAPVCVFARDEEAGISMRLTKSYDLTNDNNLARLDLFWGWSPYRPEWTALRVQGA